MVLGFDYINLFHIKSQALLITDLVFVPTTFFRWLLFLTVAAFPNRNITIRKYGEVS